MKIENKGKGFRRLRVRVTDWRMIDGRIGMIDADADRREQ